MPERPPSSVDGRQGKKWKIALSWGPGQSIAGSPLGRAWRLLALGRGKKMPNARFSGHVDALEDQVNLTLGIHEVL